jgi:hypothetical protein
MKDLFVKHPELEGIWDWERNEEDPRTDSILTAKKYWWKHDVCKQSSYQILSNKIQGTGCPICSGDQITEINSVVTKHPSILDVWSDKNIANPNTLGIGNNTKHIFICKKCDKEYQSSVKDWVRMVTEFKCDSPTGYCKHNVYIGEELVVKKRNIRVRNSLIDNYPKLIEEIDTELTTIDISVLNAGSEQIIWWRCIDCNSPYDQSPGQRINGTGCPFCSGKRVNETNSMLATYAEVANDWDYSKNEFGPDHYTGGSSFKAHWKCKRGHEWSATINSRCSGNNGCHRCSSIEISTKPENQWLDSLGVPQSWRGHTLRIGTKWFYPDAIDLETKTVYEMNGDLWHGNPSFYDRDKIHPMNGKTFGQLYDKTLEKEMELTSAGYTVVSIWESDWKKIKQVGNNKVCK